MRRPAFLKRWWFLSGSLLLLTMAVVLWFVQPDDRRPGVEAAAYEGPLVQSGGRYLTVPLEQDEISLFVAGDTILSQPWSHIEDVRFLRMIEEMRAADVTITNLEQLIHDYKGYAQAESGGTWLRAAPEIADELAWAGIDLMAHANNHTFDYGSIGVLETHDNARRAGLVLAGSGKDLQDARAPAYFSHPGGTVALVSMASSFVRYGRASRSRPDLHGRPGLNPLSLRSGREVHITRGTADLMRRLAQAAGHSGSRFTGSSFKVFGIPFRIKDRHGLGRGQRIDTRDLEANLAAIREAARNADLVVVSVHAHDQGDWLEAFARQAIDAGADVFFVQGPHVVRGIELYAGKPVFYCLGDFAYQVYEIEKLPVESYDEYGLGDDATPEQVYKAATADGTAGYPVKQEVWEGVGAALRFGEGRLKELRLLPLDLGFGKPAGDRGWPRLATGELARKIISGIAAESQAYGTQIRYAEEHEFGVVDLNQGNSEIQRF